MRKPRDLDWNDVRCFAHAARSKTLTGAARSLGVEHSTVGRRLTELERAIGASLVIRGQDGLRLTPLGDQVKPLAEEIERMIGAIQNLTAGLMARVRLALPLGFGVLLYGQLDRLRREHPGISLEVLSGNQPLDLGRGEAELALRVGPVADEDLVARKVGEVGWSLYASDSYLARRLPPADPRDLAGHELIGYDTNIAAVPGAKWIEAHGAGAQIVTRHREAADMVSAAVAGVGLAVLPCILGDTEPGLRRLTSEVLGTRTVSLVYRREALLSEPVRAVIGFVMQVMRESAALVSGVRGTQP